MSPEREAELARRHRCYVAAELIDGQCAHRDGWFDLVDRLLGAIEEVQPDVRLVQVKQKFGALRVYTDNASAASASLIRAAEGESATVCEQCGEPGTLRYERGIAATRCDLHPVIRP